MTGDTICNICKRYGTSRKTYYKWNYRYRGLLDNSKRPHNTQSRDSRHGVIQILNSDEYFLDLNISESTAQ